MSGVVAGLVRIDAASGAVLTDLADGHVRLTLRSDYGSAVPPDLEPTGGDSWAAGWFDDIRDGLEAYAAEFARLQGVRVKPEPVGYCT